MRTEIISLDVGFYRKLFRIALPIILQNVITIGVNLMDTIMLGSYGEVQLAGSSLANDFINIFQILCMGMGCGTAVLTAQYWGSKEIDNLKKAVSIMFRFVTVISSVFTIFVIFFAPEIMTIYTNEAEVIQAGTLYFYWSIPTFILMGISLTLTQVLRSIENVRIPLYASFVGFFVNIFFNWVFIFGNLGAPEMKIAGAALGTVIARVVETLAVGIYFFKIEKKVRFKLTNIFTNCSSISSKYFKYCLPVIASDSLLGFGNSAVSIIIGHMGTAFVAANAIILVIQRFCTVFTSGMGMASHTMIGNRIGEGNHKQAYCEAITLLVLSIILGIVSAGIMRLVGPYVISFYNVTKETYDLSLEMLEAICIMIVFQAMQSTITKGVLRGGGDTKFCLAIDAMFLWLVSVPLGYYAGLVRHSSAFIVIISLKADWIIKSAVGSARIISGKWIKKI
ncbi:MAG: MATE family efflux transporter [Erysipelotrichia bacterium]|nr:MATE family efflux transporter [Erysipelotrichia bacterium]